MWLCNTKWSCRAKLYVCLIYLFTLFSVDKRKPISSVKLYCTVCRLSSSRIVHFSLCKNLSCCRLNLRKTDTIDSRVLTTHLLNFSNFFSSEFRVSELSFPVSQLALTRSEYLPWQFTWENQGGGWTAFSNGNISTMMTV